MPCNDTVRATIFLAATYGKKRCSIHTKGNDNWSCILIIDYYIITYRGIQSPCMCVYRDHIMFFIRICWVPRKQLDYKAARLSIQTSAKGPASV